MITVLILTALVLQVFGATIPQESQATIVENENTNDGIGNYEFRFLTSNGIERKETGQLVNAGQSDERIKVHGEYRYTDPDGKLVVIYYTADENGYQIILPEFETDDRVPPNVVATLLG